MKEILVTLLQLAVTTAKLCAPGGARAVIAENLLLKQQLIVLRRARQRAPNLTLSDRLICGMGPLFLSPGRIRKVAIAVRPSTLLAFHQALLRGKYRRLFSSSPCRKKRGPKGPSEALIQAIVELKSRNPRFGCPRIGGSSRTRSASRSTRTSSTACCRKHYRPAPGGTGPSWLSFIGHTTDSLWSVDLFRCESIVLRSYWVLVVMDQFTRRLIGVGVHRGAVNGATSAACSIPPLMVGPHRDSSLPIMIRCSRRTVGRRTFGFWRSTKSRPCRMCRSHTHSWNGGSGQCGENFSTMCCSGMRVI